jgi:hypothetical protein
LSSYLLALFAFDYLLISSLNSFDTLHKDRYLSYTNKYSESLKKKDNDNIVRITKYFKPYRTIVINNHIRCLFKPITINKMPFYCENTNLGEYYLDCKDTSCSFNIYEYLEN